MSSANIIQAAGDGDMALADCESKRQLLIDAWPKNK